MKYLSLLITALLFSSASAQTSYSKLGSWNFFLLKHNVSEKAYLHNEVRLRFIDEPTNLQQFLIRPSFHYKLNNAFELSAGYTFSIAGAYNNFTPKIALPEHNSWTQLATKHKIGDFYFATRNRYENRFVGHTTISEPNKLQGYFFRNRLRLMPQILFDVGSGQLNIFTEFFFVSRKALLFNNQIWSGFDYSIPIAKKYGLHIGVLHQYLKRNSGAKESNLHIRLGLNFMI